RPRAPRALLSFPTRRSSDLGAGVTIGSHSASHPSFSDLTEEQQETELRESKLALEKGLGRAVDFFAYPYGDAGRDAAVSERLLRSEEHTSELQSLRHLVCRL